MALADVYLVEALAGRSLTDDEVARFGVLADYVDTLLAGELPGLSTTPTADDEFTITVRPARPELWTLHYPVTAVTEITVEAVAVDLDDVSWDRLGRLRWRNGSTWSGDIVVTYDHGDTPADLAAVAAEVLAAAFTGPGPDGPTSESLGPYSVTYAQASMMGRLAGQRRALRRWRRTAAGTVLVGR